MLQCCLNSSIRCQLISQLWLQCNFVKIVLLSSSSSFIMMSSMFELISNASNGSQPIRFRNSSMTIWWGRSTREKKNLMPVFPSGLEDENLRRVERSIINLSGQHLPDNNNSNNNNNINMSNSGNESNMKLLYSDEKKQHSHYSNNYNNNNDEKNNIKSNNCCSNNLNISKATSSAAADKAMRKSISLQCQEQQQQPRLQKQQQQQQCTSEDHSNGADCKEGCTAKFLLHSAALLWQRNNPRKRYFVAAEGPQNVTCPKVRQK